MQTTRLQAAAYLALFRVHNRLTKDSCVHHCSETHCSLSPQQHTARDDETNGRNAPGPIFETPNFEAPPQVSTLS
jgi:hypothetical protein